jgi:hypothetical protein
VLSYLLSRLLPQYDSFSSNRTYKTMKYMNMAF